MFATKHKLLSAHKSYWCSSYSNYSLAIRSLLSTEAEHITLAFENKLYPLRAKRPIEREQNLFLMDMFDLRVAQIKKVQNYYWFLAFWFFHKGRGRSHGPHKFHIPVVPRRHSFDERIFAQTVSILAHIKSFVFDIAS